MSVTLCLIEKVKEAMRTSCDDMMSFTDDPAKTINAEYLLTVNVAKAIRQLNEADGSPYRIYIEMSTKSFARDCIPLVNFRNPTLRGSSKYRKGTPKIDRNGRIDVAVYWETPSSFEFQPLCAIELKSFNPPRRLVLEDLKRNLEFLRATGNTGQSVVEFVAFAALHSCSEKSQDVKSEDSECALGDIYKRWLSELGDISDVATVVEVFTVRKESLGRVIDEGEYEVLDTSAKHHFVGIIIYFTKKI